MSDNVLQVGLPVILDGPGEVEAFKAAKERIEGPLSEELEIPMEVGVFLYYFPKALEGEGRQEAQLAKQREHKLPLVHAEPPIQRKYSLTSPHVRELMRGAIDHIAALKEYDQNGKELGVDTHMGTIMFDGLEDGLGLPGVYSLNEFDEQREELYDLTKRSFGELAEYADGKGLGMLLETICPISIEPNQNRSDRRAEPHYYPFSDPASLIDIAPERITLDIAHWGATASLPGLLKASRDQRTKNVLFDTNNIFSWKQYEEMFGSFEKYLPHTQVLHLSNSNGVAIGTNKDYDSKWERPRTPEGNVTREEFRYLIDHARETGKLVVPEVDYNPKTISDDQFKQADEFLRYVHAEAD